MRPAYQKRLPLQTQVDPTVYEAIRLGAAHAKCSGSQFAHEILAKWARATFPDLFKKETAE